MLIKKYVPRTFEKSIVHKTTIEKLKRITKDNFMNILFYGPSGSGKYVLTLMLLQKLFGNKIYIKNNYESILNIYYSSVHYEIILNKNSNKIQDLRDIIINMSSTYNISSNYYNIIVVKNIVHLNTELFSLIKYLIENNYPIYFIFLTNTITNLPSYIKNLFLKIRVPKVLDSECLNFFNFVNEKEKLNLSKQNLIEIINKSKNNLTKIFLNIQCPDYKNFMNHKLDEILELIKTKKILNILKIRERLYDLCSKNVDKTYIIKYCLNEILKNTTDTKKKIELTKKAADLQHKCITSYKETIHVEYFLVYLMDH